MDVQERTVHWKRFYVILAGITTGAHRAIVEKLKRAGQIQVDSRAQCDYLLVFCPVASRVGTDIDQALHKIPADKPAILVVMHHTFDRGYTIAESRRNVTRTNVHLTVDCLFYEGKLLKSKHSDLMWHEIQKLLGATTAKESIWQKIRKFLMPTLVFCGFTLTAAVILASYIIYMTDKLAWSMCLCEMIWMDSICE